jgi:hypothetical protein
LTLGLLALHLRCLRIRSTRAGMPTLPARLLAAPHRAMTAGAPGSDPMPVLPLLQLTLPLPQLLAQLGVGVLLLLELLAQLRVLALKFLDAGAKIHA